jgi:hypothetical protein
MGCGSSFAKSSDESRADDGVVFFNGSHHSMGRNWSSAGSKASSADNYPSLLTPAVGKAAVKFCRLPQNQNVIPGGFQIGEQIYYGGPARKYPNGDEIAFGAAGFVCGPAAVGDGMDDRRVAIRFPHHKDRKAIRLGLLSYEAPVIPGGFSVGEQVFWCGMNWTFENKDKLVFGASGVVTGRAFVGEERDDVRVAVNFSGNKSAVAMRLHEISRERPKIPGGYQVGDRVFYTYPNWKAPDGYVLTFGVEGKLLGRSCIGDGRDDERAWVLFPGLGYGCIHLEQISKDVPVIPGDYNLGDEVYFCGASRIVHSGQRVQFGMMGKVGGGREARSEVSVFFPGIEDAIDMRVCELSREHPTLPQGFTLGDTIYYSGASFCCPDGYLITYGASGEISGRSCQGDGLDDDRIAVKFHGCRGSMLITLPQVWKELPPNLEEKLITQLRYTNNIAMLAATHRTAKIAEMDDIRSQALKAGMSHVEAAIETSDVVSLSQLQRAAEDSFWPELENAAAMALEELVLPRTMQAAQEAGDEVALDTLEQYMRKRSPEKSILASSNANTPVVATGSEQGLNAATYDEPGPQDAMLIKQMQEFVDQTYTAWGGYGKETQTRDRRDNAKAASSLEVVAVERLRNDTRHMIYSLRRQIIKAEMPSADCQVDWDVKTDCASAQLPMVTPLASDLNEHYLWHGTGPTEACGIASSGFDMSQAGYGRGSFFGRGAYFAESCLKADEYVKPNEKGWFPLILCRVTLGTVNYCDAEDPGELRETLRARSRAGKYHSVLGDREKVRQTFREFVLFDSSQIYPEFIVWYRKP